MGKRVLPDSERDRRRRDLLARLLAPDGRPRPGLTSDPLLNSTDVAALFEMSERVIRLWAVQGQLPHVRSLGGGRLRYRPDEIAALYSQRYPGTAKSAVTGSGDR